MEEDLTQDIIINTKEAQTSVEDLTKAVKELSDVVKGISRSVEEGFGSLKEEAKKTEEEFKDLGNNGGKAGKSLSASFGEAVAVTAALAIGFKKVASEVVELMQKGNAVTETSNMYYQSLSNVADEYKNAETNQSEFYTKGLQYQKTLNEQLGLNTEQMEKYQAMYFNMLNGQSGITSDLAYTMSENLTNLAIDMSSLFNTDIETMTAKLQSGITGQAKALRQYGIDVTEASMASTLLAYGIDTSVESLSYGEKELLRYLTIVRQVNYAEGDFANTYNTSANQLRVLSEEIRTLAQHTGLIFSSTLSNAIVFARAIVRVFESMVQAIANFFHVDLTGTAQNEGKAINGITKGISDGVNGVSNSIGGATKKAKEFKKQLMGFDEINNITPPAAAAGGGGGGGGIGGGGINSDLLKALENTNWDLGIGQTVDDLNAKVEELANNPFIKLLAGGILAAGVAAVFTNIGKLAGGFGLLGKGAKTGASAVSGLNGALLGIDFALLALDVGLMISGWDEAGDRIDMLSQNVKSSYDLMGMSGGDAAAKTITALEGMAKPLYAIGIGFDNLTGNSVSKWASSWGDKMTNMADGTGYFMQEVEYDVYRIKKSFEETEATNKTTIANMTGSSKTYLAELSKIVDENGNIKKGYEGIAQTLVGDLANATGLQLTVAGQQIQLNGQTVESYKALEQAVNDQIKAKQQELEMRALEAQYDALLAARADVYVKLQAAEQAYEDAVASGDENLIAQAANTKQQLSMEASKLSTNINQTARDITSLTAKQMNQLTADMIKNRQVNSDTIQEIYKTNKDSWKQTLSELDDDTKFELLGLTTSFDNLDQDLADDWKNITTSSENGAWKFNSELALMDDETKTRLVAMTGQFDLLDDNAKSSIADFANTSPEKFENALSGMDDTTKAEFKSMVDEINNKKDDAKTASQGVADNIQTPVTNVKNSGSTWGLDFVKNLASGLRSGSTSNGVLGKAVSGIVSLIKNNLGHSVPKEGDLSDDDKWGLHFVQNLANGINKSAYLIDDAVNGIVGDMANPFTGSEGITVDKNLNANAMVDYASVTGQIKASMNSNNIAQGIAVAVQQALQRANINIRVDAHADTGIMVEAVVDGINSITNQTNEFPLTIPI